MTEDNNSQGKINHIKGLEATLKEYSKVQSTSLNIFFEELLGKIAIKNSALINEFYMNSFQSTVKMYINCVNLLNDLISQQLEILENTNLDTETRNRLEIQFQDFLNQSIDVMEKELDSYKNSIDSLYKKAF